MRVLRTLRGRITLAATGAILLAVVVFAVVTVRIVDVRLRHSLDGALRSRAVSVAELAVSAPAVLSEPGALEGAASGRQIEVEVLSRRGVILARSPTLGAEILPRTAAVRAAVRGGRPGYADVALDGHPFRLYAVPIADAGGPAAGGAVLAASDTSDIARTTGSLGAAVAIAGAAVVALLALAAALLTRRALRPLERLAAAAEEIERTADPTRRLPSPGSGDELAQLTGVLNRMLAALEAARAGERRFLADASHELRTPITALMGNVAYAARHGADAEVLADLALDAERLGRLIDDLLALERAEGGPVAAERVAVVELIAEARERVRAQGDRVAVPDGRVLRDWTVAGDRRALARALGNLIENGLRHGPPGAPVTVTVATARREDGRGWVRITVSDTGPGPSPQELPLVFERFRRGRAAAGRPGSGLGLSIAAAVAAAHGGEVTAEGASFTLGLPRSETVDADERG